MFKKLDLLLLTIILSLIAFIVSIELIKSPIIIIIGVIVISFMTIPIYNKCISSRKKFYKKSFWGNYWYDMKCKLVVIPFALIAMGLVVWITGYVS